MPHHWPSFPRPTQLSDPLADHTAERLVALLSKSDGDLGLLDYKDILGPFITAGSYEESVYFLPLAFDFIRANEEEALDLVTSLVWFVSEYASELSADKALDVARKNLADCLSDWTATFAVVHFDEQACKDKGWKLTSYDYVQHTEVVMMALGDLVELKVHADLAVSLVARWACSESTEVESAWFLECARAHVSADAYHPPAHPKITPLLDDPALASASATRVRQGLDGYSQSASYWRDVLLLLGLAEDA